MELLSPAGNYLNALSALKGGADAIYLGGKSFSARASADNFSNEELRDITRFAHSIGRKVYVTLNTLLYQDEFFLAVEFAKFLYEINVDGVIIQDLGLASYLHKTMPGLPLNASTQLNCHNVKQAEALIKIGFKRIVLAREADLAMIKAIKDLGVEVEVFVHGALCVSYSGNCLMSSFIGDRSGNRGRCAQPCRMSYSLYEDGVRISDPSFAISTKDLMTLDRIGELAKLGVDSFKIEGRLKTNEYIYQVTKSYRHAIDSIDEINKYGREDRENLQKIFSRKFTRGYLFNESPFRLLNTDTSSHQGERIGRVIKTTNNRVAIKLEKEIHRLDGIRFNDKRQFGLTIEKMFLKSNPVDVAYPNDIIELSSIEDAPKLNNLEVIRTKDYLLNKSLEDELKEKIKVQVDARFRARANSPLELSIAFEGKTIRVLGENALESLNKGTSSERIVEQLKKSGEYPYEITTIEMDYENCFIPISMLNKLRNDAFEALQNALIVENEVIPLPYHSDIGVPANVESFKAIAETEEQRFVLKNKGLITFYLNDAEHELTPRISSSPTFGGDECIANYIVEGNGELIASPYCNITNSYALDLYFEFGFKEAIVSFEVDRSSLRDMMNDYRNRHGEFPNVGIMVYGKADAMIMKSCPIGTYFNNKAKHCNRCHNHVYQLNDRMNCKYHMIGDKDCNIRILMDRPIYLLDKINELRDMNVSNFYLSFTDEDEDKCYDVLSSLDNDGETCIDYTRGHYNKRAI
ncbi:MAG: U32 family peptidase [Bacilli bacterium]|nr:U32 family peptidase [Bacilli bacterium]